MLHELAHDKTIGATKLTMSYNISNVAGLRDVLANASARRY